MRLALIPVLVLSCLIGPLRVVQEPRCTREAASLASAPAGGGGGDGNWVGR